MTLKKTDNQDRVGDAKTLHHPCHPHTGQWPAVTVILATALEPRIARLGLSDRRFDLARARAKLACALAFDWYLSHHSPRTLRIPPCELVQQAVFAGPFAASRL